MAGMEDAMGTALLVIIIFGILVFFGFIIVGGVNKRYPKIKFLVFEGESYGFGTRRLKEGIGIVKDDLMALLFNTPMLPTPIADFELSYMFDAKGEKVYLAYKTVEGQLIPVVKDIRDNTMALRIENYKEASVIATGYLDLQDRIRKTAEASNPIMAVILPLIPAIVMFSICFIAIYMVLNSTMGAYGMMSDNLVKIVDKLDSMDARISGTTGVNPVVNGVQVNPPTIQTPVQTNPLAINPATGG